MPAFRDVEEWRNYNGHNPATSETIYVCADRQVGQRLDFGSNRQRTRYPIAIDETTSSTNVVVCSSFDESIGSDADCALAIRLRLRPAPAGGSKVRRSLLLYLLD
jgi:hypothetical protein